MRVLPLYPERPMAAVEDPALERLERDTSCVRCKLGTLPRRRAVCIGAEVIPGAGAGVILFVGDHPTNEEDSQDRPFVGGAGKYIRALVGQHVQGTAVLDYAARCAPGRAGLKRQEWVKYVAACRGYLAAVVDEVKPTRIVALGTWASTALVDRVVPPGSVRKGYGWTVGGVPIYFLPSPVTVMHNRFLRRAFEEDFQFAVKGALPQDLQYGSYALVNTWTDAVHARRALCDAEWVAFDVEACGTPYGDDFKVISVALATPAAEAFVWTREGLASPGACRVLLDLLTDPQLGKVAHNAKYDLNAVRRQWGVLPAPLLGDTMLWRRLLEPEVESKLEVAQETLGMGGGKAEAKAELKQAINGARRKQIPAELLERNEDAPHCADQIRKGAPALTYAYGLLPSAILDRYNAMDTVTTAHLAARLEPELRTRTSIAKVWDRLVMPGVVALAKVEHWGIAADRLAAANFSTYLQTRLALLMEHFKTYGDDFNPGSTKQVAALLFDELRLQHDKETGSGGRSTDKEVLADLRGKHEVVDHLIEYRSIVKMDGTYARGMIEHIAPDGRIHPSYRLDGTETGRLSCEQPNLQNIPRAKDSAEGKMARDIFTASPGCTLVQFDYSQLELRRAAMLSGDPEMAQIFASGVDYHLRTAQLIAPIAWSLPSEAVTDVHRSYAKTVNFGLLYGKTDAGLAAQLGCSWAMAAKIRQAILGRFKHLARWLQSQINYATKHGGVWIPWLGDAARWRPLPGIGDADDWKRMHAANAAVNTPIQGSSSEFCLASIARLIDWIEADCVPAKLVLTVHDSIALDVERSAVDEVIYQGKRLMEDWPTDVPLAVDVERGDRWGSLEAA